MDKDGNKVDGEGTRPQKHAKSPELARDFLLDAATVIFKEQVKFLELHSSILMCCTSYLKLVICQLPTNIRVNLLDCPIMARNHLCF
jgi:hypothetical protein